MENSIELPVLQTKLQLRNGSVGCDYHGADPIICRHDFKVTDVQITQLP